ncbi:MAG: Na+/H+ antiporter [Candidatus Azobacteroides sp.]|nr:Na+/H+ antiporter [Candidatus Azobacteroides sp.]
MFLFEYILILLAAVCLSNIMNRFMPVMSVPIIQIALGAFVTLLPLGFRLELDPDLFFVLFVAPLIFRISLLTDKKTLWAQRKPILNASILLLLITIVAVGYLVNLLIPSIPLAAAFALVAALGPTDDVAVASVGKRVNVPPKIMNILQGESIINDASGIVSFQFAMAAMLTGSFSPVYATGRFFVVALGGIAVGLLLSWFKHILIRWIRSLGMENVTLHLLLSVLTPFVIYLIAEGLGVSGILAVFAAGITHSLNRDKFNPERVNFNIASESVWSMLSFTFEGLVFVILGTQLPRILASISENYSVATWEIIVYILLITLLLLLLRFVWSIVAIKKKNYDDPEHPAGRFRMGVIFSLSGARGAVTLVSVMSIPFLLTNGEAFPERDLIILIAGGVIVISLIITSFILPLCVEKQSVTDESAEDEAYSEILQNVIVELKKHMTPENEGATAIVIANYHSRSAALQHKHNNRPVNRKYERELRITTCEWEKENVMAMLARGETSEFVAQQYLDILDTLVKKLSKNRFTFRKINMRLFHRSRRVKGKKQRALLRVKLIELMKVNARFVLEKLKVMSRTDDNPALRKIEADYELKLSMYQKRMHHSKADNEILTAVVSYGFQAERDNIQAMFEAGRISRETAGEMRHNISLLEAELNKNYF